MGNQDDEARKAADSGDFRKALQKYEEYVQSMKAQGQTPKSMKDVLGK